MRNYIVLEGDSNTIEGFQIMVNKYLNQGYVLAGGVSCTKWGTYIQAVYQPL